MVAIETWLEPVFEYAATRAEVKSGGMNPIVDIDNVQIKIAARMAYSQIRRYCGRNFHNDLYTDYFELVGSRFRLINYPVESITSVYYGDYLDILLSDENYILKNNQIWLKTGISFLYITATGDWNSSQQVMVTYEAGTESVDDLDVIRDALIEQTVANYLKRQMVGIDRLNIGGKYGQGIETRGERSSVIASVKEMINTYVYYSDGEDWS